VRANFSLLTAFPAFFGLTFEVFFFRFSGKAFLLRIRFLPFVPFLPFRCPFTETVPFSRFRLCSSAFPLLTRKTFEGFERFFQGTDFAV
jgi:hypothetical protein